MTSTVPRAWIIFFAVAMGLSWQARADQPDDRYWRLDDILAQFASWQLQYPDIFHRETLGLSGEGEPIPMARVSDHASVREPEPLLLIHAAQHANECNGTGAVMKTIEHLLEDYDSDPKVRSWVDGLDLRFVPVANVDGHRYVFSGQPHWMDWRKTLRDNDGDGVADFPGDGVDTNRNWDWFWGDCDDTDPASQQYKGPEPFSESEARALRDFVLEERPLIVVDYHSPVTISWHNTIFYPWVSQHGWGESPDYDVARDLAEEWASMTLDETGQAFDAIWAWDTLPKEQCWVYGHAGILSYVMEISDHCWWSGAAVDTIAARVARGGEVLFDRALSGPGIFGTVVDADSGNPLGAEVRIEQMHGDEVGPRFCEARFGQYYRLTLEGDFTLSVSCPGYEAQQRDVSVGSAWVQEDFQLVPISTGVSSYGPGGSWSLSPNPARPGEALRMSIPEDARLVDLDLLDVGGRRLARLGRNFPSGAAYGLILPDDLSAGVYLVRARWPHGSRVWRETLLR